MKQVTKKLYIAVVLASVSGSLLPSAVQIRQWRGQLNDLRAQFDDLQRRVGARRGGGPVPSPAPAPAPVTHRPPYTPPVLNPPPHQEPRPAVRPPVFAPAGEDQQGRAGQSSAGTTIPTKHPQQTQQPLQGGGAAAGKGGAKGGTPPQSKGSFVSGIKDCSDLGGGKKASVNEMVGLYRLLARTVQTATEQEHAAMAELFRCFCENAGIQAFLASQAAERLRNQVGDAVRALVRDLEQAKRAEVTPALRREIAGLVGQAIVSQIVATLRDAGLAQFAKVLGQIDVMPPVAQLLEDLQVYGFSRDQVGAVWVSHHRSAAAERIRGVDTVINSAAVGHIVDQLVVQLNQPGRDLDAVERERLDRVMGSRAAEQVVHRLRNVFDNPVANFHIPQETQALLGESVCHALRQEVQRVVPAEDVVAERIEDAFLFQIFSRHGQCLGTGKADAYQQEVARIHDFYRSTQPVSPAQQAQQQDDQDFTKLTTVLQVAAPHPQSRVETGKKAVADFLAAVGGRIPAHLADQYAELQRKYAWAFEDEDEEW